MEGKLEQDNVSGSDFKDHEPQTSLSEEQNLDTSSSFENSYQSSPTSPPPSIPHARLDIPNHDDTFNLRKLLQSGVRIPSHLSPMIIIPLLTRANISHVRMLLLERQINGLEGGENPSLASEVNENDKDRERETLQGKKEALMYQMLSTAREAIDLAGLLNRPDLQARGFWYLAIAAKEEGNEHLWESYLEQCLEAKDSFEGMAAEEELGIHENGDEYEEESVERSSIFGEEAESKEGNGALTVSKIWRWGCEHLIPLAFRGTYS